MHYLIAYTSDCRGSASRIWAQLNTKSSNSLFYLATEWGNSQNIHTDEVYQDVILAQAFLGDSCQRSNVSRSVVRTVSGCPGVSVASGVKRGRGQVLTSLRQAQQAGKLQGECLG